MRITGAIIVGTEHLRGKGLSKSARSADANQSIRCPDSRIQKINQHVLVNIVRVSNELKPLISGVYIQTIETYKARFWDPEMLIPTPDGMARIIMRGI